MKRARLGTAAVLLGVLLVGGCSDDEPVEPDPSPNAGETSGSPSGSGSPEPTGTAVEPATGETVVADSAHIRAPEGWRVDEEDLGLVRIFNITRGPNRIDLADFGAVSSTNPRELARDGLTNFEGRPQVSYDAELGGEEAYLAVGTDGTGPYVEYGAVRGGQGVVLAFSFERTPAAERAEIVDSVLTTFTWN